MIPTETAMNHSESRAIFTIAPRKCPPCRVLVVDDEALMRWSVAETLAKRGHTVIEAVDGATAKQALTDGADAPDVILLDYRLPDSTGLALLPTLRRSVTGECGCADDRIRHA